MTGSPFLPRWTPRTIAITALLLLAVLLCWTPAFNALADRFVDDGLKRSLLSFATARALHSAVSVLQGTELAVQPMGVGLTLTLGQVLAPISDLIAQFADWMLWASVAFGMQKLLLSMGGSYWVTGVVTVVAISWLVLHLRQRAPGWLTKLLVVLLFTRLVMPVTIIGSEWLFTQFMAQTYQQNQLATEGAVSDLQKLEISEKSDAAADNNADSGLWSRLQQLATKPGDALRAKLSQLQQQLDQQVERLVTLIVVFALQTIVIPLTLIWALVLLCKGLLTSSRPTKTA